MEQHTPKQFVLQLGSLVSLYLSLAFLLVLLFGVINIFLPDAAANDYWQRNASQEMVRLGLAMVIVFFPTYLILTRLVNKARRKDPNGAYLTLTKWLIYLSLLVGGGVLLGDLVAVVNAYLDGEITSRFVLKASAVLVVIGAAFFYYLRDARGFWVENEKCSIRFGSLASVLVLVSLVTGVLVIDSPQEVRERKLDETQLRDLSDMQNAVATYLAVEGKLPESLAAAYDQIAVPEAPAPRPAYTYELTEDGFKLCAVFATASENDTQDKYAYAPYGMSDKELMIVNLDDWNHKAGEWCFERKVVLGANEPVVAPMPTYEELDI